MEPRSIRPVVVLVLAISSLACTSAPPAPSPCRPGEERAVSDSLYFGTSRPQGGEVTAEEWQRFIVEEVTPRFPQGLTSWQASGQWLSAVGTLQRERSYVLYIVHPDTAVDEKAIQEIVDRYRVEFQQEAVLRVRTPACISV